LLQNTEDPWVCHVSIAFYYKVSVIQLTETHERILSFLGEIHTHRDVPTKTTSHSYTYTRECVVAQGVWTKCVTHTSSHTKWVYYRNRWAYWWNSCWLICFSCGTLSLNCWVYKIMVTPVLENKYYETYF
jgi:hypothetical protein